MDTFNKTSTGQFPAMLVATKPDSYGEMSGHISDVFVATELGTPKHDLFLTNQTLSKF